MQKRTAAEGQHETPRTAARGGALYYSIRFREALDAILLHAAMPDGESWEQAYNEVVQMARDAIEAAS